MAIKWGSTYVTAVKWGNTTCTAVKWGSTKVFPDSMGFNGSSFDYPIASGFNVTTSTTKSGSQLNTLGTMHYGFQLAANSSYPTYADMTYIYFTSKNSINLTPYKYIDIDCSESTIYNSQYNNSGTVHWWSSFDTNLYCSTNNSSFDDYIFSSSTTTITAHPSSWAAWTLYRPRAKYTYNVSSYNSTYYIRLEFYAEGGTLGGGSRNSLSGENNVRVQIHSIKFYS